MNVNTITVNDFAPIIPSDSSKLLEVTSQSLQIIDFKVFLPSDSSFFTVAGEATHAD